jgi:hypothetical protein
MLIIYLIQEEQKEQPKVPVDPITPTPQPAYSRSPKVSIVVKIIVCEKISYVKF